MEEPWTTAASRDDLPEVEAEFAQMYVNTPRIEFSDTLDSVPEGVQLVRSTDAVAQVTRLKQQTDGDLDLGGASLAASLIDLIRVPALRHARRGGGGKPFFAARKEPWLRLAEHRAFASGTVYPRYERALTSSPPASRL
jgi:hypothetical protein